MQRSLSRRKGAAFVLGVSAGLVAASVAHAGSEPPDGTGDGGGEIVQCGYAPSDTVGGDLAGFGGTTPYGQITDQFITEVCEVDPNLEDFNYAAETYDAVTIIALAVESAGTDGIEYASHIVDVTREGEKCSSFAECRDLLADGADIDYDGASGPIELDGNGDPTQVSYALLKMGDNNRIDPALTEFITAGDGQKTQENDPVEGEREGDGVLTIGSLLPQTGSLAFLGPPEFAGFDLAVADINAAGGVLGNDVVGLAGDSGDTSTNQADQTVDRHLAENADAIVGAASSSVTLTVIDKITSAGVVMFSPANTSTDLSDYPDRGLYFRTAPPDVYQGDVIGQFIINDGHQSVALMNLNDSYGNSLAAQAIETIEESGGEVVAHVVYDPAATSFDSEVGQLAAADADAIWLCGFNESSRILRSMVEQGIGPQDVPMYGCDGNIGNALGADYDAGQ